LLNLEIF